MPPRPPALSLHRPLAGARARVFAFPHAGGGASAFNKLRDAFADHSIELCPVQPAGRESRSREPLPSSVEAIALDFSAAIASLPPLPFALLGHSLGGLTAYLTAQRLVERGLVPEHLIASGSVSPTSPRAGAVLDDDDMRRSIIEMGGVPDAILRERELYAMFEAVIMADMRLGQAYRHRPAEPLPCPITVYSAIDDRCAPPEAAEAWRPLTRRALSRRTFAGGHFFLYADARLLAETVIGDLGWSGSGAIGGRGARLVDPARA